jgi:hypothetical protein
MIVRTILRIGWPIVAEIEHVGTKSTTFICQAALNNGRWHPFNYFFLINVHTTQHKNIPTIFLQVINISL